MCPVVKMPLLDLPNELLLFVAGSSRCGSGINALARTNRRLYCLLGAHSYQNYT